MFYCPNPSCKRNLRKTKKPFPSDKSFSNHLQQSTECKVFLFEQTSAATTLQSPSKRASINTTTNQLFKKQCLRLNPTFSQQQHLNSTNIHRSINDDDMDDDDPFPFEDNADQSGSQTHENAVSSQGLFADTTETRVESDYSSFTTSQQCVTSLMYLLDAMECPNYAFKKIMEWVHTCFEVGFDFNLKCKTCLGNLKWMYDALHNAEQMLPHLESIPLPDPLPNVNSVNVICYDFVPQLLSILQNRKMMSAENLVLDPNNPLAMYKPHDSRLGGALSGSVYRDMYHCRVSNPSKQLLCPLICYTDGTQVDSLSRFGVEPFLFTPAVLSHAARCKADAW